MAFSTRGRGPPQGPAHGVENGVEIWVENFLPVFHHPVFHPFFSTPFFPFVFHHERDFPPRFSPPPPPFSTFFFTPPFWGPKKFPPRFSPCVRGGLRNAFSTPFFTSPFFTPPPQGAGEKFVSPSRLSPPSSQTLRGCRQLLRSRAPDRIHVPTQACMTAQHTCSCGCTCEACRCMYMCSLACVGPHAACLYMLCLGLHRTVAVHHSRFASVCCTLRAAPTVMCAAPNVSHGCRIVVMFAALGLYACATALARGVSSCIRGSDHARVQSISIRRFAVST